MKNKGLIIVICSSIVLVFVTILYIFNLKDIDSSILYEKWYHYNYNTGDYEIISIDNKELLYYFPTNDNYTDEYSFCKNYKYNKIKKSINLDCGKTIYIENIKNNKLILKTDGKEKIYFKNINDSKNYEFKEYYSNTIDEFINIKKQALEIIEINKNKLIELFSEKDYSKIIFIGDKCNTIECILIYDLTEKWMSYSVNVYYVNSNNFKNDDIKRINNKLNTDINYNDIYPLVIVVNNNKLIDLYKIKCSGFNCSMFYNK